MLIKQLKTCLLIEKEEHETKHVANVKSGIYRHDNLNLSM